MNFFNKLFRKKKNNDLMKTLQQNPVLINQMLLSTSVNYKFACKYLRKTSFSNEIFDNNYMNSENTAKWIAETLNSIEFAEHIAIKDEYYNMLFKFVENDSGYTKAIIIEVPNPKFECECNYVGIVKNVSGIHYYTNELYVGENAFYLCEFKENGSHMSYSISPKSMDEFINAIIEL